jgi:4-aminobutyrate aminotransferase-like enzyme
LCPVTMPSDATRPEVAQCDLTQRDLTRSVTEIFRTLLDTAEEIDAETDFFDAGGNSILAARAVARIRAEHRGAMSMRDMFFGRTPAAIAARLAGRAEA